MFCLLRHFKLSLLAILVNIIKKFCSVAKTFSPGGGVSRTCLKDKVAFSREDKKHLVVYTITSLSVRVEFKRKITIDEWKHDNRL